MGMFDTVLIENIKLKAPKEVTSLLKTHNKEFPNEFQTKDLDSVMGIYRINSKWELYREEKKPTGKKVIYNSPLDGWHDNRSFLERLYWNHKNKNYFSKEDKLVDELKSVFVKAKLTQTFNIYSLDEIGYQYLSLEYSVKVIDGTVSSIKLVNWEIESEKEALQRKKDNDAFKAKMDSNFAKRKEFQSQWYYPILKETYNPFIFFSRLLVQNLCNKLVTLSYRWTGV